MCEDRRGWGASTKSISGHIAMLFPSVGGKSDTHVVFALPEKISTISKKYDTPRSRGGIFARDRTSPSYPCLSIMPQEINTEYDESNLEDILLPPDSGADATQDAPENVSGVEAVTQEQASEPPVPSQPAVSSLPASLATRAKAAGLPLDDLDSSDKLAEFILDRYVQDRAYADYGRQSLARGQASDQQADREPAQEAQAPKQPDFDFQGHWSTHWQTHKLDAAAEHAIKLGIVEQGEDGLFHPKQGYETLALPVINQINQAHLARQEQVKSLFEGNLYENLDKVMWPAFEHRMKQAFEERLNNQFTQYRNEQQEATFIERFQEHNKAWLYDAQGNLTPEGQKFRDTCDELYNQGITDTQKMAEYAIRLAGINTSPTPPAPAAPAAPAAQTTERPRGEDGKFIKAAPAPTKQETFIDRARRHSAATESRNLSVNNNTDYQVANEGELENMFMNAWKQAAVA